MEKGLHHQTDSVLQVQILELRTLLNIEKNYRIGRRWQESDSNFQSTLKDVDHELRVQLQG